LTLSLAGCSTAAKQTYSRTPASAIVTPVPDGGAYYTIKKGDTLMSISRQYGVDVNEITLANDIKNAGKITRGQVIIIPSRSPITKDRFVWPVKGAVISRFGSSNGQIKNKGIDIRTSEGKSVVASRSGRVVFCDDAFKGLGKTVILDHGDSFQTVYAYNSIILVNPGDIVRQNAEIARVGSSGRAKVPTLHFEVRKDGVPRNPVSYLSR